MFKKFILAAAAALALSFVFVSCDKEDDPVTPTPAGKTAESVFNFTYSLKDANTGEPINLIKEAKLMLNNTAIATAKYNGTAVSAAFTDYSRSFFDTHKNDSIYWVDVTANEEVFKNFPDVVSMNFSIQFYTAYGDDEGWDYFAGDFKPSSAQLVNSSLFNYCKNVKKIAEDDITKEVMDQYREEFGRTFLKHLLLKHHVGKRTGEPRLG